jgi:hypothetical protein
MLRSAQALGVLIATAVALASHPPVAAPRRLKIIDLWV